MRDVNDPWVAFEDPQAPVQPWQQAWEFSKVLEVFGRLNPRRILEIGTYNGGTLYQWLKRASKGSRVGTIDITPPNEFWSEWATIFQQELHIFTGDSTSSVTAAKVFEAFSVIDFLLIDGNHQYEAVKQDWEIYAPRVRAGGVIVLHDILPMPIDPLVRVDILWAEIKAAGYRTEEWYIDHQQGFYGTGVVHKHA